MYGPLNVKLKLNFKFFSVDWYNNAEDVVSVLHCVTKMNFLNFLTNLMVL
jgi:hypothetical protein